jgi:Tol biopolymer transport system component
LQTGEERTIRLPQSFVPTGISTWSDDGESMTFHSWTSNGQKGLYEFFPRGGKVKTLVELDTGVNPPLSWSPGGNELLYGLWPNKEELLPIMIYHRLTGQIRQVTLSRERPDPCWSPDGREIAFHDGHCLKVISSQGGESRQLACAPWEEKPDPDAPTGGVGHIAWSPNGNKLAWSVLNWAERRVDLWTVDYFSGQHVVTPGEANFNSWPARLEWSPDGKQIAFERRYLRKTEIWRLSNFLP